MKTSGLMNLFIKIAGRAITIKKLPMGRISPKTGANIKRRTIIANSPLITMKIPVALVNPRVFSFWSAIPNNK